MVDLDLGGLGTLGVGSVIGEISTDVDAIVLRRFLVSLLAVSRGASDLYQQGLFNYKQMPIVCFNPWVVDNLGVFKSYFNLDL